MLQKSRFFWEKLLLLLKPLLTRTLLKNEIKIANAIKFSAEAHSSGMVTEFNFLHRIFYKPFFRRVQTLSADIKNVRELSQKSKLVFVIKNRGQLEYRYFNDLFLKERLKLVSFSNKANTIFWWPFAKIWQYFLAQLSLFYQQHPLPTQNTDFTNALQDTQPLFINLRVSRNDLFGLTQEDPLAPLRPLIESQKTATHSITIIPIRFLYDKQPEKSEKTFFDLLFGEKSCPGGFRKLLLMLVGFRKTPQAKFGEPIDLKSFIQDNSEGDFEKLVLALNQKIEDVLRIEHAKITGPKLKNKTQIIKNILDDPAFLNQLEILANNSRVSEKQLKRQAEKFLHEIAADVNYSYVHFFYVALDYLWNHVYDGVIVKHEQLAKIRSVAGKNPIVLVPMHRSHIDYLLISYIFYANNITFPHTCAGINMNFWPIGSIFRKGGAFFIRRSIQGDKLYKETLGAYLKTLLKQDYCIEFFIEGTRSRTGKMLKPRLGILKMLLGAFEEGLCDDIHFVPIAINYDHIFEEKAYASEHAGKQKQKENAGNLLKTRKFLGRKYGKVYIEFGDPISFADYHNRAKSSENVETLTEMTQTFGYYLTREMNRIALVTPISLVSLAIFAIGKNSFTHAELMQQIQKCKHYLNYKNVSYSDLILYNEDWAYQQTLQTLIDRHLIKEIKTYEGVFYHVETQKRIRLDYYKNNILHFFVSLSCLCKIFLEFGKNSFTFEQLIREYKNLKVLFDEEFTFSASSSLDEHVKKILQYATDNSWVSFDGSVYAMSDGTQNKNEILSFANLLDNFIETHRLTLQFLKYNDIKHTEQASLIREILEKSKPLYLKSDYRYPEALGQFYIESSLNLWSKLGLLETQLDGKRKYHTCQNEKSLLESWINRVQNISQNAHDLGATQSKAAPTSQTSPDEDSVMH